MACSQPVGIVSGYLHLGKDGVDTLSGILQYLSLIRMRMLRVVKLKITGELPDRMIVAKIRGKMVS